MLDSKEKFHEDLIAELKSQNHSVLKEICNSLKEIKELTITLANSRNEDLLCKLDQLNITLQKNNGHLYGDTNSKSNLKSDAGHTAHFSKELNDGKIKFYQAFRSQELSSYYKSLINREEKFVPEKFRVKKTQILLKSK